MTLFQPCTTARQYPGYNQFNPACLYCGARILQHLGTLHIPPSECRNRRRNELAIWVAHGHNEALLRELAKSDTPALAPESGPAAPAVSAHPQKAKRR
jgi:hypothetical protein